MYTFTQRLLLVFESRIKGMISRQRP